MFLFSYFRVLIINCIASKGKLVGGTVLSFTNKLDMQDKEDLSNAVLLAQLVADHHIKGGGDPITMGRHWYEFYMLVLKTFRIHQTRHCIH